METYHRRKYTKPKETNSVDASKIPLSPTKTRIKENQYSKETNQSSIMSTVAPTLARHGFAPPLLPISDRCSQPPDDVDHDIQMVAVGSLYEIDHIHLPPRTPVQLRSIRVAMVSEKTHLNMAVRFPSMESLKSYFRNSAREMYPQLDEKFVMGTALASKVLSRQVPSHEFAEKKHLVGFWLVNAAAVEGIVQDACSKKDCLLSALKCNGMVRWGTRRQVKFLERHQERLDDANDLSSNDCFALSVIKRSEEDNIEGSEGQQEDDNEEDDEEEEEKEDEEEESETEEVHIADAKAGTEEMNGNFKRKRYMLRQNSSRRKAKKIKPVKKKLKKLQAKGSRNKSRELLLYENPKDRWSSERYELATKNLLEVMKAKGATASNPIIRPDLRAEARKWIGDTGLLDHLLKHMAGKIAPGGEHRFRRRHNADGAMEYWLESSDLVNIRKQAGVNDPFWIPPPGWKPGDSPTQDPVCAKELRLLKEEIFVLKRKSQEMVPKELLDEELTKLRRELESLASSKKQVEHEAIEVPSDPSSIANSLVSSKSHLAKAPASLQMYQHQLMVISDLAKGIEQEMKKLLSNSNAQEETRFDYALKLSKESSTEKERKRLEAEQKTKDKKAEEVALNEGGGSAAMQGLKTTTTAAASASELAEEKAAKIQRLRSGFRICKPQGTFLWPNMARPGPPQPQVVVQVEDLFLVPTPPSVTSSTSLAPPQLPCNRHPTSPVKPLAERRAVTVTVSTMADGHGRQNFSKDATSTTKLPIPINLNDVPSINPNEGFCDKPSTYQTIIPTAVGPPASIIPYKTQFLPDRSKIAHRDSSGTGGGGEKEAMGHSEHKSSNCCSSSASCLSSGVRNWLALATASSASDESILG